MSWKATRLSVVFLVLASWMLPAFAEVQNVKVGGDITVRSFYRKALDLNEGNGTLDDDAFIMSTVGLNVGADLTENVSAFIRLANERDWNVGNSSTSLATASDFSLSQAYVTFKELFYSPLTVRIGQQPIVWGRGFVLGGNLLPSILGDKAATKDDRHGSITANEYTDFTAFDAIRATLDLSNVGGMNMPLTADYVYIKSNEGNTGKADDVTISGINLGTKFDQWSSEAEVYYLYKDDKSASGSDASTCSAAGGYVCEDGAISTMGLRGSVQPMQGTSLWGELAWQFGTRVVDSEGQLSSGGRHSAWAFDLGLNHTFADIAMTPSAGAEWRFYSGKNSDGAAPGWSPIAPGYFTTAIREFQQRRGTSGFYPLAQGGVTAGQTNQHEFGFFGGLKPMEDLNVNSRLSWFFLPVGARAPGAAGNQDRHRFIGTEWDTQFKYNYTDDVQFGLLYALFLPGSVFRDTAGTAGTAAAISGNSVAQQVVTTVSVKF